MVNICTFFWYKYVVYVFMQLTLNILICVISIICKLFNNWHERDIVYFYYQSVWPEILYINWCFTTGFWLPLWALYFETWHITFNFGLPLKNIDITCLKGVHCFSTVFTVYRPTNLTIWAPLKFHMCSCHGIPILIQINVLSWFHG